MQLTHVEFITPSTPWLLDWNVWVSFGTLTVALTTAYYAWETRKLRKANDRAIELNREAMHQQAEATKRTLDIASQTASAAQQSAEASKQGLAIAAAQADALQSQAKDTARAIEIAERSATAA